MAPSADFAASDLFCEEDSSGIFEDGESGVGDLVFSVDNTEINAWDCGNLRFFCQDWSFNAGNGVLLPDQGEDCLGLMFKREIEHLPCTSYLKKLKFGETDLRARNEAIDWMGKVHCYYNFGPLCAYLSINYLDRFLSAYGLPNGKAWMMQLLAVACLSLAAKMEETRVPLSLDLQIGESRFLFEAKTIQRMELLVLSTLKWRMQSVTPFSFLDHFLCRIYGDQTPPRCFLSLAIQLILNTTKGIELMEFRPSEIAAAVVISLAVEIHTFEGTDIAFSLLSGQVDKEALARCVEKLQEQPLLRAARSSKINGGDSISSLTVIPIEVLDDSDTITENSSSPNPNKRRKLHYENKC